MREDAFAVAALLRLAETGLDLEDFLTACFFAVDFWAFAANADGAAAENANKATSIPSADRIICTPPDSCKPALYLAV